MNRRTDEFVIFAPDSMSMDGAMSMVAQLRPRILGVKFHGLYDRHGPDVVRRFKSAYDQIFVCADLKIHDKPGAAAQRVDAIAASGANMITVHAAGGLGMIAAAIEAADKATICVVTVPSWLSEENIHLTYGHPARAVALNFARLAERAGARWLVCSSQEIEFLKAQPELAEMHYMVPGTRFAGSPPRGQKRFKTPLEALKAGSDLIVMSSEPTQSADPVRILDDFQKEIDDA